MLVTTMTTEATIQPVTYRLPKPGTTDRFFGMSRAWYYAADKRYIGNAVQVFFKDGTSTERIAVDFPIGHRKRRAEGMPVLVKKFEMQPGTGQTR